MTTADDKDTTPIWRDHADEISLLDSLRDLVQQARAKGRASGGGDDGILRHTSHIMRTMEGVIERERAAVRGECAMEIAALDDRVEEESGNYVAMMDLRDTALREAAVCKARCEAMERVAGGVAGEFEGAVAEAENIANGRKGMQVSFHGDFAGAIRSPSTVARMRWWAREIRSCIAAPIASEAT